MANSHKVAVLASGGLDSAILIGDLLKRRKTVYPIFVRSGHVWESVELYWLKRFLKNIGQRRLKPLVCLSSATGDLYRDHWSQNGSKAPGARTRDEAVYLPGKNLLLTSKAAIHCALQKIPTLALAPLKTNPFPDARPKFFKQMAEVASGALEFEMRITTPFLTRNKNQVMKLGKSLPLHLTFSCLAPKGRSHCGHCNKCAERKKAFRDASLPDRTRYAS